MIDTLIFDFGNVFINLDIESAHKQSLKLLRLTALPDDIISINKRYEIGAVSTERFLRFYNTKFPHVNTSQLIDLWNIILKDFPKHRMDFLKTLKNQGKYKLILLSNTNALHINYISQNVSFYNTFKSCFDAFYLSHEIGLRKPNEAIFEFVLREHDLNPKACLFIDDTALNTDTAKKLGMHTWTINPSSEDVSTLFITKKHLFQS